MVTYYIFSNNVICKYLASTLAPMVGNTPHHIHNSEDFAKRVCHFKLKLEETMLSYDVICLFHMHPYL